MKQGLYLISPDTFENAADLLNAVKNIAKTKRSTRSCTRFQTAPIKTVI